MLTAVSFAYFILARTLIARHGKDSVLASAIRRDFKGKLSVITYAVAIVLSFINPLYACVLYILVAIIWLLPNRRIEKILT